ncbi:MAG: hypothetical protein OXE92_07800 [Bacteroidetes bacterium]|nr:hypothetical protein [Bacteroidota bacterium]MCY4205610.1 hypothetical protein [Bacteroidota bacterium]
MPMKFLLLITVSFFLIGLTSDTSAQVGDSLRLGHFQKSKTITLSDPNGRLSDELLIAQIKSLDVDSDGRLLVTDLLGSQAFLFDPDGTLLASLDPSYCHPGFEVRPVNAVFVGDQSIFLANAGPWGYRFTSEGECLGSVHSDYTLTMAGFLDVSNQGTLVGYYTHKTTSSVRLMTTEGETIREIDLPSSKFPNASDRINMGGIVADQTHVFVARAVERDILKIDFDGTIESSFSHRTPWFQDIKEDIPAANSTDMAALMRAAGKIFASTTLTSEIFELTDKIIMVQYRGPKDNGYQLFTKEGLLIAEQLGVKYDFDQGKHGLTYRITQLGDEIESINPVIEIYRFIEP